MFLLSLQCFKYYFEELQVQFSINLLIYMISITFIKVDRNIVNTLDKLTVSTLV